MICSSIFSFCVKNEECVFLISPFISSESLLNIINDVLNYSKLEQGQVDFISEIVEIRLLIERTINIFKAQAIKKEIQICYEINNDFPTHIRIDKQNFRQILYNLHPRLKQLGKVVRHQLR